MLTYRITCHVYVNTIIYKMSFTFHSPPHKLLCLHQQLLFPTHPLELLPVSIMLVSEDQRSSKVITIHSWSQRIENLLFIIFLKVSGKSICVKILKVFVVSPFTLRAKECLFASLRRALQQPWQGSDLVIKYCLLILKWLPDILKTK